MRERSYKPCKCFRGYDTEEDILSTSRCVRCGGNGYVPKPELVCNGCGGSMHLPDTDFPEVVYGLGPVSVIGGYSSPHLSDLCKYSFCLCELCLRKMFDTFKVPPTCSNISISGEEQEERGYDEDRESWLHRLWVEGGGPEKKAPSGKCTYDERCNKYATYVDATSGQIHHLRRHCQGHVDHKHFIPCIGVRPVPVEEMSLQELRTLELSYVAMMFGPCGDYSLDEDHFGYHEIWCPEIIRMAEGLPELKTERGDTVYSVLFVKRQSLRYLKVTSLITELSSFLVEGTKQKVYQFEDQMISAFVLKMPKEMHRKVCEIPGVKHSARYRARRVDNE